MDALESDFCAGFEGEGGEDRLEMMRLYGEFRSFRNDPAFLKTRLCVS